MTTTIDDYPVRLEWPVAWGEMDAYQHVNNATYFRYFEHVRIAYFEKTGVIGASDDDASGAGPILHSIGCRFRAPVTYPDQLTIGARCTAIGEDRFTIEHVVHSKERGFIVAIGDGVTVSFDYARQQKVALPHAWRAAIETLEGRTF